jgi:outer membrane protein OmpA-like peptidoglycan-associated protein
MASPQVVTAEAGRSPRSPIWQAQRGAIGLVSILPSGMRNVARCYSEQEAVMQSGRRRFGIIPALLVVAALAGSSSTAVADEHVRGVITGQGDAGALWVQTDTGRLAVLLNDVSRVHRIDGIRPVKVSSAELSPGLRIRAEGRFETPDRFTADHITFTKEDFRMAAAILGGLLTTDQRSLVNQAAIAQHAQQLAGHDQRIAAQGRQIDAQGGQISAAEQRIAATSGALAATNTRIANLDDYTPVRTLTVYFANGRSGVSKSAKEELQQLAQQAQQYHGYMISVAAFASAVGAEPRNQKLSMERADNVTAILQQSGVPLTNVFVPAAMGTTGQVASNKTAKGQAENRRAVITLLQNKGLGGK